MINFKTLTLKDICEALKNNGYDSSDITHATFEGISTRYGLTFRYTVIYRDSDMNEMCNVYVYVSEDGLVKADF